MDEPQRENYAIEVSFDGKKRVFVIILASSAQEAEKLFERDYRLDPRDYEIFSVKPAKDY